MGGSAHSPPTHGNAVERSTLLGLPIDSTQGENGAGTEGLSEKTPLQTTRQEDGEGCCSSRQMRGNTGVGEREKAETQLSTIKRACSTTHMHNAAQTNNQTWERFKWKLIHTPTHN